MEMCVEGCSMGWVVGSWLLSDGQIRQRYARSLGKTRLNRI